MEENIGTQNGERDTAERVTQDFGSIFSIINLYRQRALQEVNNDSLLIAWNVGAFVSQKIIEFVQTQSERIPEEVMQRSLTEFVSYIDSGKIASARS